MEQYFIAARSLGKKPKRTLERVFALFPILRNFCPVKAACSPAASSNSWRSEEPYSRNQRS
jgi:hypothetical protein